MKEKSRGSQHGPVGWRQWKRFVLSCLLALLLIVSVVGVVSPPPAYAQEPEPSTIASVGEEIDWSSFWQTFKQYTVWDLEWYDGSSWVSAREDLEVQLSYPAENERKVNLVFDASHAGNYRLTFAIDKVVKNYISRIDKYQYELIYDDIIITFDWSDCADISGLIFTHGIKNDLFWFRIRRDNVPLGAHIEIDPTTVGTTTSVYAVSHGHQRKSFYAEGLFWAFYFNGTYAGWEFSADGTTWSGAFTSIGTAAAGFRFSVYFDGTYVHYARRGGYDLFYRRGVPEDDGTITWSAVEQLVYDGEAGDNYQYPNICVDTNGYAWIGAYNDQPDGDDFPVVLKNDNNDGTWSTDFTYELSAIDEGFWKVTPIPLTNGKVYVIYARYVQPLLGKLWSGSWGSEENDLIDYAPEREWLWSAVAIEDNVHIVYNRDITYSIRHNERVYGVGWDASDVLVQGSVEQYCSPVVSADPSEGTLNCFWLKEDTDHVYYKEWDEGWDADPTDWIDETTDDIKSAQYLSSFYADSGGILGLLYVTKLASPYNVRFAFLEPPNVSPVNDGCVLTNPTDTDDILAQYVTYIITSNHSDADGYADLVTIDLTIQTGTPTERVTFRFTVITGVFSELSGATTTWELVTGSCVNTSAGDDIDLEWHIRCEWDATEESDLDFKVIAEDSAEDTDTDTYDLNYDVITTLNVSGFASSPAEYINPSTSVTYSGTVYYVEEPGSSTCSAFYPPDAEFTSVVVNDVNDVIKGTDPTIVNGAFSLSFNSDASVGQDTYHPSINMTDSDYYGSGTQTATLNDPIEDGYIVALDDPIILWNKVDSTIINWGVSGWLGEVDYRWRGYVEWDLSTIPDTAIIQDVVFQYEGALHDEEQNSIIRAMAYQPSVRTAEQVYNDIGDGTQYLTSSATFVEVGTTKAVGTGGGVAWSTSPESDLQASLEADWFALGFQGAIEYYIGEHNYEARIWSEDKDPAANPKPTLYIEYKDWEVLGVSDTLTVEQEKCTGIAVSDARDDVGDTINIDFTLIYASDSAQVVDGTHTIEGEAASHQGSGVWRLADSEASVQQNTYNEFTTTGSTRAITSVDQNGQSDTATWDQIEIVSVAFADNRVNINSAAEVRYVLRYDYDDVAFETGDGSIVGFAWDASGWWDKAVTSPVTVGADLYDENDLGALTDSNYDLTVYEDDAGASLIGDQMEIVSVAFADDRININSEGEVRYVLRHDYDDDSFEGGDGSIVGFTWDAGNGWWDKTVTAPAAVGDELYDEDDLGALTDSKYGITVYEDDAGASLIGDRVQATGTTVSDSRDNIGDTVTVDWTLIYDYDDAQMTDGTVEIESTGAAHQGSGVWRISPSEASVTSNTYNEFTVTGNTYGITSIDINGQTDTVIWDQVVFKTATTFEVDAAYHDADNTEEGLWYVELMYDFDDTEVEAGTVTLNVGAMSWDAGDGRWEHTTTSSSVQSVSRNIASLSASAHGITVVHADVTSDSESTQFEKVKCSAITVSDARDDVGDTINIDFTLVYESDSAQVIDGTVTIEGEAAAHQGSGVWRFGDSEASVQQNTYNEFTATGNARDIDTENQDGQSDTAVWDRIEIYSVAFEDSRIDIGSSGEVRYIIRYEYDVVTFDGDKGSIIGFVYDVGNGWWDKTFTGSASVTTTNYDESDLSITDSTYGLTAVEDDAGANIITDRINFKTATLEIVDGRIDFDASGEWYAELLYEFDSAEVTDGTVTLNTGAMSWDGGDGRWEYTNAPSSVTSVTRNIASVASNTHGITALNSAVTSDSEEIIFDRIEIVSVAFNDSRIDISGPAEVRYVLRYEYDLVIFNDGKGSITDFTYDAVNLWWERTIEGSASVVSTNWDESDLSITDSTYGLTAIEDDAGANLITDRIRIDTLEPVDGRIDLSTEGIFYVVATLEYDSHALGVEDTFVLTNYNFTWNATESRFEHNRTETDVLARTLNSYTSGAEATYGITAGNINGKTATLIWDRIKAYWEEVDEADNRLNVDDSAEWRIKALLEYDDHPLGSGDTITTPWGTMTWDGGNSWLELLHSESGVGAYTISFTEGSEATYGITVITDNITETGVIFDRVKAALWANITSPDAGNGIAIIVTGVYDFDEEPVQNPTYNLNKNGTFFDSSPTSDSEDGEITYLYTIKNVTESAYGITRITSNTLTIQWGNLQIDIFNVSIPDGRVGIDTYAVIYWNARYGSNNSVVPSGNITIDEVTYDFNATGWAKSNHTNPSVGSYDYSVTSVNVNDETDFTQTIANPNLIFDRARITSLSTPYTKIDIGTEINITATADLQYDTHSLGAGDTLVIDDDTFTWDADNSRFYLTQSYNNGITKLWDELTTIIEITYGISVGTMNDYSLSVEWAPTPGGGGVPAEPVPVEPPPEEPPEEFPWVIPEVPPPPVDTFMFGMIGLTLIIGGPAVYFWMRREQPLDELWGEDIQRGQRKFWGMVWPEREERKNPPTLRQRYLSGISGLQRRTYQTTEGLKRQVVGGVEGLQRTVGLRGGELNRRSVRGRTDLERRPGLSNLTGLPRRTLQSGSGIARRTFRAGEARWDRARSYWERN